MQAFPKKLLNDFLGSRAVLVIEPRPNYRNSIKQFLTNLKVNRLLLVASVAEAKRAMLTNRIGFFIVEWALDDTNGLQFCRGLRKDNPYRETPFLLLSTENLRQDVILASEVQIDGYLLKPFSSEDFYAQLHQILKIHTSPSRLVDLLEEGESCLAKKDINGAESAFKDALKLREKSARGLCGLARVQASRKDLKGALKLLRSASDANPDYIEAYRLTLEIYEQQEDRSGVEQTANALHALSPENPRYTLVLAKNYLEMSHLEAAENFFKKTVSLSPRMAEAYKGLGNLYLAKDEYDKAMKSFNKALDLDAEDVSTLNSLGTTYVRMGLYREGIEKYMVALKLDPRDFRVLFNLGYAYEKRGDIDKAKYYYTQSLASKPGYDKALRGLERANELKAAGDAPLKKSS